MPALDKKYEYWPEERVTKLRKLWKKGYTATEIGKKLGNLSRSSIVGKVKRLNLEEVSRSSNGVIRLAPYALHGTVRECQWPIGEPGEKGFHFCSKKVVLGKSYCRKHYDTAYITDPEEIRKCTYKSWRLF